MSLDTIDRWGFKAAVAVNFSVRALDLLTEALIAFNKGNGWSAGGHLVLCAVAIGFVVVTLKIKDITW